MKKTFYSNGKLLITGEYVVLDEAIALGLPTKFGQNLFIEDKKLNQIINWKSLDNDLSVWFEDTISFQAIKSKECFENPIKNTLVEILHEAHKLNSDLLLNSDGFEITTQLTFPRNWGLGTSSTLINNIAQWFKIDAFALLRKSFGGSGYDIACAQNNFPILFQLVGSEQIIKQVSFKPTFHDNIYFVYLNKKQSSKIAIENYRKNQKILSPIIIEINLLTDKILKATNLIDLEIYLKKHENIISQILETKTIQETLFPDFCGVIKSLGAWGGDFVMVICEENPTNYFKNLGYPTLLKFEEIIL